MGFLDDLKRQAGDVQARQQQDSSALERNTALVESACQTAAKYFNELVRQLDVLQPVSKWRYSFDNRASFTGLKYSDFATDQRKKRLREQPVTDYIECRARLKTGQTVKLAKDFINEMQRVEAAIRLAGVTCTPESIRNPDNGKLMEVRYEFVADILAGVRVQPDHDRGLLHFTIRNFDGLEMVECDLTPVQVSQQRLDELAKWWVGQPHQFLAEVQNLRRVEPR
jgi:hypothetical protein